MPPSSGKNERPKEDEANDITDNVQEEPASKAPLFIPNPTYGTFTLLESAYLKLLFPLRLYCITLPITILRRLFSRLPSPPTLSDDLSLSLSRDGHSHLHPRLRRTGPSGPDQVSLLLNSPRFSGLPPSSLYSRISTKRFAGDLWCLSTDGAGGVEKAELTGEEDVVVLYTHGGAYVVYESGHQAVFVMLMLEAVVEGIRQRGAHGGKKRKAKVACLVVDYSLAPEVKFPGQNRQAAEALRLVLGKVGAERVVVMGDSAGGNLALGMLTSLTYPLPALERTNTVNDYPASQNPDHDVSELKIGGLILLSPWLTFTASSPAYTQNRYLDYVSATFLLRASQHLRPGPRSPYISRFRFYTEFLAQVEGRDLDRILPEKLWIHAGGNEILLDDTKAFVDAVRKQRKERKSSGDREEVTLEVIEGKMHNPAVLVEALEKREVGGYLGRKIERDEEGWEVRWGEGLEGVLEITEGVGRVIAEWAVENNGEGENGQ